MDFSFIKSNRFWAIVGVAVLGVLQAKMLIDPEIARALMTVLLGHIGLRTIDRATETLAQK